MPLLSCLALMLHCCRLSLPPCVCVCCVVRGAFPPFWLHRLAFALHCRGFGLLPPPSSGAAAAVLHQQQLSTGQPRHDGLPAPVCCVGCVSFVCVCVLCVFWGRVLPQLELASDSGRLTLGPVIGRVETLLRLSVDVPPCLPGFPHPAAAAAACWTNNFVKHTQHPQTTHATPTNTQQARCGTPAMRPCGCQCGTRVR
jgi:hypothetical protein